MEGRVASRGRLGRDWSHVILSNMARQIDRVARQGGEGVQDALYMSEGGMSRKLGNSYTTWQVVPQISQYASDSMRLYSQFIISDSVGPSARTSR
jgi:hypothetical protein